MTMNRKTARLILPIISVLAFGLFWHFSVMFLNIPDWLIPSPAAVLKSAHEFREAIWDSMLLTLYETFIGFGIAIVVGIGLAILFVWVRTLRDAFYPIVLITQAMPKIAIAPLLIVWMGPTDVSAKIIMVFLISFFPILVNSVVGLESIDRDLIDLMRTMRATRWRIFVKLQLPGAVPHIFSGLKVGITMAVTGALVGELMGGNRGLGYLMNTALGHIDTALMFAVLCVLTVMAMVLFYIVEGIDRFLNRWQDRGVTVLNATA
jgi:NitT/TauT family transport system permease protein